MPPIPPTGGALICPPDTGGAIAETGGCECPHPIRTLAPTTPIATMMPDALPNAKLCLIPIGFSISSHWKPPPLSSGCLRNTGATSNAEDLSCQNCSKTVPKLFHRNYGASRAQVSVDLRRCTCERINFMSYDRLSSASLCSLFRCETPAHCPTASMSSVDKMRSVRCRADVSSCPSVGRSNCASASGLE